MSEQNSQAIESTQSIDSIESQETSEINPAEQSAIDAVDSQETMAAQNALKAAEKALKKKIKLKVDGEELEEEIDFEDEDSLRKHLQLSKVAQKRMNEYAQLEKEVRMFVEELKKNPRKVLSDPTIGIDIKQLAAQVIEEEIENAKKSPEQLEKERLEAELRALKEERDREKEEAKRKEFERLEQQTAERYDNMITSALTKGDLPKSPYVVKKIADYMYMGLQEGLDISPDDVIPLVKEEMASDLKQMFALMPEDAIEQLVGSEVINKIRKKRVAAAKTTPPAPVKKSVQDTGVKSQPEKKVAKTKTFKQFFGV